MRNLLFAATWYLLLIGISEATCLYPPPIASQADADQFTACSTVTGDISIATNVVGNIKIDGPKVITGNLFSAQCLAASNCTGMKSLSSSTIQTINKDFHLQGIQNLTSIDFPALTTVQTIVFLDLVAVETVAFDKGLSDITGGTVHMEGMSSLQNLSGLAFTEIDYLSLHTGPLSELALLVEQTSEFFSVGGDGSLHLDASVLRETSSLTIFGCADVNLAALVTCANVDFEQNKFATLSMPAFVSSSYSYLTIGDNANLNSIDLPLIQQLDTLWIWGNPDLTDINGFSKLTDVDSVKVSGNFTDFTLPAAVEIGEFVIDTSDKAFDCSNFYQMRNKSIITGYYECQGVALTAVTSTAYRILLDNALMVGLSLVGVLMASL